MPDAAQNVVSRTAAKEVYTQDFTDGAGHGILVATSSLRYTFNSTGTNFANSFRTEIFYRMKKVKLEEFIGLVATQSNITTTS